MFYVIQIIRRAERKELKYLDELTVKQNLRNKTLKEIGRAERKELNYWAAWG